MSDLLEIREHLQDTIATLAGLERAIAASDPVPPSVLLELKSLEKRKKKLEDAARARWLLCPRN